uniref:hypothetical protein n=1 Tax=Umezakia ovalisporum TaxID=75695 RepID=UPI0039C5C2C5
FKFIVFNAVEEWVLDRKVFSKRKNDGVVPLPSVAFQLSDGSTVIPNENTKFLESSSGINHLNILEKENEEVVNWIKNIL